jgi:ankyrin repeat protein
MVKVVLSRDTADVNAQNGIYSNPLQAASYHGSQEVVQLLLNVGAEVNAQGGRWGNALQAASAGGSHEVVQLLVDAGAKHTQFTSSSHRLVAE